MKVANHCATEKIGIFVRLGSLLIESFVELSPGRGRLRKKVKPMEYLNNFINRISESLGAQMTGIVGALLTLIIGFIVAKLIKSVTKKAFRRLDDRFSSKNEISEILSKLVYYVILIFVLILALDMLGFGDALEPLKGMWSEFVNVVPNLIGAGIIGYAGYMLASIMSQGISLVAERVEKWVESKGVKDTLNIAGIIKQLVFIFVFVPILIVSLQTLNMTVISDPATEMLNSFMGAIPKIIAAGVIFGVFYVAARLISSVVKEFLINLGADNYSDRMGLTSILGDKTKLSSAVSSLIFFFIMFAGIISGLEKIELTDLTSLLSELLSLSAKIIFGLIIVLFGNFISKAASSALTGANSQGLASIARFAILGLFLAMGLRAMGIADDIVNLAFALTLGAIAVAVALSFGLGGREAAGEQMKKIINRFNQQ